MMFATPRRVKVDGATPFILSQNDARNLAASAKSNNWNVQLGLVGRTEQMDDKSARKRELRQINPKLTCDPYWGKYLMPSWKGTHVDNRARILDRTSRRSRRSLNGIGGGGGGTHMPGPEFGWSARSQGFNAALSACARDGQWEMALHLLTQMESQRLVPNRQPRES